MKKVFFLSLAAVALMASCSSGPEGVSSETGDAQEVGEASQTAKTYAVETAGSRLRWYGSKPTGEHWGYVQVQSGSIQVEAGKIVGGEVVFDMTTIDVQDIPANDDNNGKLVGHLKNPDFFNVDTFPTAKFVITSVEEKAQTINDSIQTSHMVTGNLTLRDKTKSISFPANVTVTDAGLEASSPQFLLNRLDWGITYNSTTIFADLKEYIVHDNMGITIAFKAKADASK